MQNLSPRTLATIQPTPIHWLWQNGITRNKLTPLAADPATGTTALSLDPAARLSTATPLPSSPPNLTPNLNLNPVPPIPNTHCPLPSAAPEDTKPPKSQLPITNYEL